MKKLLLICLTMFVAFTLSTALAVDTFASNEPLAVIDPHAVKIADFDENNFVKNEEHQDNGTIWLGWNENINSKWGCSTASMNYTNPINSNIGLILKVGVFDSDLVSYFGTTFRSETETRKLAISGLNAIKNGLPISALKKYREVGMPFEGITQEEFLSMETSELVGILSEKGFLGRTCEEILSLTEDDIELMSELERLDLAQLADYDYYTNYQVIGESGIINPGYALYQIDLHTLPGYKVIPHGNYRAFYEVNAYDAKNNKFSNCLIHIPITLNVEEDLPKNLQTEYGITLAEKLQ